MNKPATGQLDALDLSLSLKKKEYEERLEAAQLALVRLQRSIIDKQVPVIIAMEGWDAAGKGGAIKRFTQRLDPRGYEVIPVGAPTPYELARHYLWRFWVELPPRGRITVFDRSWYGRVLVERVEQLCPTAAWRRAYDEINAFEKMLVDDGAALAKFYLHFSQDEQLKRFRARENNPFKRWKITEEDWRNREKWDDYRAAVEEMLAQTSTPTAPWTLVEAECKRYARVKVAETVVQTIEAQVEKL